MDMDVGEKLELAMDKRRRRGSGGDVGARADSQLPWLVSGCWLFLVHFLLLLVAVAPFCRPSPGLLRVAGVHAGRVMHTNRCCDFSTAKSLVLFCRYISARFLGYFSRLVENHLMRRCVAILVITLTCLVPTSTRRHLRIHHNRLAHYRSILYFLSFSCLAS